jgi:hypothetical protein
MSPQDLERAQAALRDSARRFKEAEELSQDAKGIVVEGATVTISGFVGSLVRSDLRREWVRLARLEPTVRKTSLPRLERDVASLQVKHREAALKLAADRARLEAVRHAIMEEVAAAATIAIREEEEITPEEEDDPELELAPPAYSA